MDQTDPDGNEWIKADIFLNDQGQGQEINTPDTHLSTVTKVQVAEMPRVYPVNENFDTQNNHGVTISLVNTAGTANDNQEVTQVTILPLIHTDDSDTTNLLTGNPLQKQPIKDDYTLIGQSVGIQVHKISAEKDTYGMRTSSFGATVSTQLELTYKVTFDDDATEFSFKTTNLPSAVIGQEAAKTATAVTLNGIGTKFGIYDELEHAFRKHAPYVGNHGGTVVLQNIAQRGFEEPSDAPELFEVHLSKAGRLKYVTTDIGGLLVAQVVKETHLTLTGVTGAAQSNSDATFTHNNTTKSVKVGDIIEQLIDNNLTRDEVATVSVGDDNTTIQLKMKYMTKFDDGLIELYRKNVKIYTGSATASEILEDNVPSSKFGVANTNNTFLVYNEMNMSHNGKVTVAQISGDKVKFNVVGANDGTQMDGKNLRYLNITDGNGSPKQTSAFVSPHQDDQGQRNC